MRIMSFLKLFIKQSFYLFSLCLYREADFQSIHQQMSDKLEIVGFLDIADVASPCTLSRHLVLPTSTREKIKIESNSTEGV
jgi:hypothetical protein